MKQQIKLSKTFKIFVLCLFCVVIVFIGINTYQNQHIQVNEITITSEQLPEDFAGYRIAHISDLHNAEFGEDNEALLSAIKDNNPDIIVITGDIVDSRQTDVQIARDFINSAAEIAPVYYVTGNHESRVGNENNIDSATLNENVNILHNNSVILEKGESEIQIIGVDDPDFANATDSAEYMSGELSKYCDNGYFKILLSHRPELFDTYAENNMNIVFSGHAHGGQVRLPFLGGVIAPHQGLFPEYDSGLYTESSTNMIVSRGVGDSILPLRINNPPEIIIVTLEQ